jgi:hypothetical protein
MVISPKSEFFRFFTSPNGGAKLPPPVVAPSGIPSAAR